MRKTLMPIPQPPPPVTRICTTLILVERQFLAHSPPALLRNLARFVIVFLLAGFQSLEEHAGVEEAVWKSRCVSDGIGGKNCIGREAS